LDMLALFTKVRGRAVPAAIKRFSTLTLAALMLLGGCNRYRRPCSSTTPDRKDRSTDDRDLDSSGVIRPREFEPIPSTSVPTTPRSYEPSREPTRTETYSPPRATPKLGWTEPSLPDPLLNIDSSPTELPSATDHRESKKFWITPDGSIPDGKKPSTGLATPDRGVMLEPIAPKPANSTVEESASSLPTVNTDTIQRSSNRPAIIEDRVKPVVAKSGLNRLTKVRGLDEVSNGDRPTLEGLDSLKNEGFRTVVYFHLPKADTSPARQLCEQRGLTLVAIPISAEEVASAYASFAKALQNKDRGLTYVCDEAEGLHTGVMWYGYFRRVGLLSADASMVRAQSLGLPNTERIPKIWQSALAREFDNK
jgi:hypothetical protein